MKREETLEKMFSCKMVRITKSFREYWEKPTNKYVSKLDKIGQWFYIQTYNDDDTVQICSNSTHQIFKNAPISELR